MPLLEKKAFSFDAPPEDIKIDEEVFVIEETREVFRSYKEYIDKILLYSSQIWSCQYTGKSELNFKDALESETKALKLVKQFPKSCNELVLRNTHHWTTGLDALVDKCYKEIPLQFREDDLVNVTIEDQVHTGKIVKIHEDESDDPPSPSSDKENNEEIQSKPSLELYEVLCDDGEVLKNVKPDAISHTKKGPSKQLISLFIRASMSHPVSRSEPVYVIKKELLEKYKIPDKLKDYSIGKKNVPSEPLSTIQHANNSKPKKSTKPKPEKPKKTTPEKSHTGSKGKAKKIDPLQRSLDCFRIQPKVNITKCSAESPIKVKKISDMSASPKRVKINATETEVDSPKKKSNMSPKCASPKRVINNATETKVDSPQKKSNAVVELKRIPGMSPVKVKQKGDKVTIECLTLDEEKDGSSYEIKSKKSNASSSQVDDTCTSTKDAQKTNAFSLLKSPSCKLSSKSTKKVSEKKKKEIEEKKKENEEKKKEKEEKQKEREVKKKEREEKKKENEEKKKEREEKKKENEEKKKDREEKKKENEEKKEEKKKEKVKKESEKSDDSDASKKKKKEKKSDKGKTDVPKKSTSKKTKQNQETSKSSSEVNSLTTSIIVLDESQDKEDIDMVVIDSPSKKNDKDIEMVSKKPEKDQQTTSESNKAVHCITEGNVPNKQKKQKTLSEMFNAALQRKTPHNLSKAINQAIVQNVSPFNVLNNVDTPARNKIKEKYEKLKEKHRWKMFSAEEKQKIIEEKREKKRQERLKILEENRQERLKILEENKKIEDTDLELKPLPAGKAVTLPDELSIECFADVVMVVEFMFCYKELFVPGEKFNLTVDSLMQALTAGEKGFAVLSKVLFILLQTIHQELHNKRKWIGFLSTKLTELPLTLYSAPELARLYLEKVTIHHLMAYQETESELLMDTLKEMENQEYYVLKPQQKLMVIVGLYHAMMSLDVIDNYIESTYKDVQEMRREKMKQEKMIRDKKLEEREKNEQLKTSTQDNTQDASSSSAKPIEDNAGKQSTILTALAENEKKNENDKGNENEKVTDSKEKNDDPPKQQAELSELALTVRNRRLQMDLRKQEMEKKEKEDQERYAERLMKEEEEMHKEQIHQERKDTVAKFNTTLRMTPLGYDRYHRRYWLFNGMAGLYVEDGWMEPWNTDVIPSENDDDAKNDDVDDAKNDDNDDAKNDDKADGNAKDDDNTDDNPKNDVNTDGDAINDVNTDGNATNDVNTDGDAIKDVNTDGNAINDVNTKNEDCNIVKVINTEITDGGSEKTEINKECADAGSPIDKSWRDVPYSWTYYNNIEDITKILDNLTTRGVRESDLHKVLQSEIPNITKNIKKNRVDEKLTEVKCEDEMLLNLKESVLDLADRITRGNLGEIEKYEKYLNDVEKGKKMGQLVIKLQKSILPRFLQGNLSNENFTSQWCQLVEEAMTISRLHLLLDVLDSAVTWDKSAEGMRCKICRKNGKEDNVLLLCDECNLGFHLYCLRPALTKIPKGEWKCLSCKPRFEGTQRNNRTGTNDDECEDSEGHDEDDESIVNEDYCHLCQEGGEELVCCDTCPLVFHKDCHEPPLRNIPRGVWSCMECKHPKKKTRQQSGKAISTRKAAGRRRDSDESSDSNCSRTRRNTRKRQLEEEDDSEEDNRKKRKTSRKRPVVVEESEEEEDSDDDDDEGESGGDESSDDGGDDDGDDNDDDDNDEPEDEEENEEESSKKTKDENQRSTKTSNNRATRNSKASNQQQKRKAPSNPEPKTTSTSVPSKRRRTNPELEVCEVLLIEMLRSEDSWPFLEPVNVKEVPDYLDLVSEPMDFKTIKEKLEVLEYSDAGPFARDIRLVFANCDKYNHISTEEGQAGDRLAQEFEKLLKEHFPRFVKTTRRSTRRR